MNQTILLLICVATVSSLMIYGVTRSSRQAGQTTPTVSSPETATETVSVDLSKTKPARAAGGESRARTDVSNQAPGAAALSSFDAIAFTAAIDTLVSLHSMYAEKRAAWKQLMDSGRLADAAAELEKRMAADPNNAVYPAELGQAYLKLCATTTDVRSQAVWAMTADKDFETALNLDPSNWDARFTKAVAMSYWPDNLNKGPEVIQQFNMLIAQQEQQAPQAQFAQTYEWLGKQYQKTGQPDAAQQIWQRGASLYPADQSLQSLLTAATAPQQ
jgi:tetratricopeptide (TPR) repeat protein